MDIVNRLLTFMETHGIGSTQFADSCGIPRPTLSQILSGRNKKISDAVISKIHNAYPRLSVLWLLFGEGQMETTTGGASREPLGAANVPVAPSAVSYHPSGGDAANERGDDGLFSVENLREPLIFDDNEPIHEVAASSQVGDDAPTVTIPADGTKSIVNIMVFYSDNSYQSFIPR